MIRFFSGGPGQIPGTARVPHKSCFGGEEQSSTSPVTRARLAEPRVTSLRDNRSGTYSAAPACKFAADVLKTGSLRTSARARRARAIGLSKSTPPQSPGCEVAYYLNRVGLAARDPFVCPLANRLRPG